VRARRGRRPRFAESAAASDLAFLLIIYFIAAAGFGGDAGFQAILPASSPGPAPREGALRFEMDGGGRLLRGGLEVAAAQAAAEIARAREANPAVAVMLAVDPAARWQDVVSFVEMAHAQRVEAFSLAMRGEADEG